MTTKQELLHEAYRLGAQDVNRESTVTQLKAAIKEAEERGVVRYGGANLPVCRCGRPRNHIHPGERDLIR